MVTRPYDYGVIRNPGTWPKIFINFFFFKTLFGKLLILHRCFCYILTIAGPHHFETKKTKARVQTVYNLYLLVSALEAWKIKPPVKRQILYNPGLWVLSYLKLKMKRESSWYTVYTYRYQSYWCYLQNKMHDLQNVINLILWR